MKRLAISLQLVLLVTQTFAVIKPKTHVWVGQQVLHDVVSDGKVTLNGKEYTVAPEIVQALRLFPNHLSGTQLSDLEAQRLAVAKIRVRHAESGVQTAAAIYVGNDQQNAYFITAYHSIDPEKGGVIESVELQFVNSPQSVKAEIVEKFDQSLDLGIVKTSIRNVPSQLRQLFANEPIPGTAIRIIGHPPSGEWSVWSGRVENENAPQGDSRQFIANRDSSLTHGYSGGAIFDMDGNFLGMHLETTATYAKELKSREILNLLVAFRVPTNNFGPNSSKGANRELGIGLSVPPSGAGNQLKPDLRTVDRVDYAIDGLQCPPPNKGKKPNYLVDSTQHLLLNEESKPVSPVDSTGLKELDSRRLIVVHTTAQILRLSRSRFAHVLIMRDGTVKQLVPFNYAVDHVYNGNWKGLSPVKNHTIAVELENAGWLRHKNNAWYDWLEQIVPDGEVIRLSGDIQWRGWHTFTSKQLHAFSSVVCALRSTYPTLVDMVEHSEIDNHAADPGLIFPMEELRIKLFPKKEVLNNR